MELSKAYRKTFKVIALLLLVCNLSFSQSKFKVTLDAGHGAHDYGAVYHGHIEKNITLAVVLKVEAPVPEVMVRALVP